MLTPYDFLAITGLKLGGERIKVNDAITSTEIKSILGVMPSKIRSKNVSLMWLFGTLLCLDLGSTVSLRYLWSLRDISRIKNYDWGGMAFATLLHFMTQLSQRSLLSLKGAPFVW